MIALKINSFLIHKLIKKCGQNKENWEELFSKISGFKVCLPYFFWEVELLNYSKKKYTTLTLELNTQKNWMQVFFQKNLSYELKRHIKSRLFSIHNKCL
ncbi:MAG: hypothetical protein OEZ22_07800 [Spirochaetia bacterium]|nr:hypothetical protein [Spirochaetia bacterium]